MIREKRRGTKEMSEKIKMRGQPANPWRPTRATGTRDSSKHTAETAGLNEDDKGGQRPEKAHRAGQCAGLNRYGILRGVLRSEVT